MKRTLIPILCGFVVAASGCRSFVVDAERPIGLDGIGSVGTDIEVGYAVGRSERALLAAPVDHRTGTALGDQIRELREARGLSEGEPVRVQILRVPPPGFRFWKMLSGLTIGLIPISADDTFLVRIDRAEDAARRTDEREFETVGEEILVDEAEETLDPALVEQGSVTVRTWVWSPLFIGQLFSSDRDPVARRIDGWLDGEE